MIGPFKVLQKVGYNAYKLELPPSMKIHNVFHSSLLWLAPDDPLPGQQIPEPPPIVIDGQDEWEVDKILDSRRHYQKLQYKVKWIGFDNNNE